MKLSLDENNFVILDLEKGAKIIELKLRGHLLIKDIVEEHFLGGGSYLMFPWVSRIEEGTNPYKKEGFIDAQGSPLHGFCCTESRIATVSSTEIQLKAEIRLKNSPSLLLPEFVEIFELQKNRLKISFIVLKNNESLPYCFGYHPYIQIDDEDISTIDVFTDLKMNCQLREDNLLPIYPFIKNEKNICLKEKYDHLFIEGSFVELKSKTGVRVKIESDLEYWQIYTPGDGKRVAIEPMSFCGNVFKLAKEPKKELVSEGWVSFECELEEKNGLN